MSRPVYSCHLCDAKFHDALEVINIFSVEGKQLKVAAKIFFVLSIMIAEDDPTPKFICRPCFGQIEVNVRFAHQSRMTHYKHMKNSMNLPSNHKYKEEVGALLGMPIHSLFYRHFSSLEDLQGMYDALIKFMKNADIRNQPVEDRLGFYDNIFQCKKNATSSVSSENRPFEVENVLPAENNSLTNGHSSTNGVWNKPGTHLDSGKTNRPEATNSLQENSYWEIQPVTPVTGNNTKNNLNNHLVKRNTVIAKKSIPSIILRNLKSNHVKPNSNIQNRAIEKIEEEVICLDDDDDDDDDVSNDTSKIQPVTENVDTTPPITPINNLTNNINKKKALHFEKTLVRQTDSPPSHSRTEEISVTPDLPMPDTDVNPLTNPVNPVYYDNIVTPPVVSSANGSPIVTPETGFHFLYKSDQTVDLTRSDDLQQKKPMKYKRKHKNTENLQDQSIHPKKIQKKNIHVPASSETTDEMMQPSTSKTITKEHVANGLLNIIKTNKPEATKPSTKRKWAVKSISKIGKLSLISSTSSKKANAPSTSTTIANKRNIDKLSLTVPTSSETADEVMQPSTSKTTANKLSIPKSRPKRASAVASSSTPSTPDLSQLIKIGKHAFGEWKVWLHKLDSVSCTCPLCKIMIPDFKSRIKHEKTHFIPIRLPTNTSNDECDSTLVNTIEENQIREQQEFLSNLNLVRQNFIQQTPMDLLLSRKNFIKALECNGLDVIGSHECSYCNYVTCRLFILAAHVYSSHIPLYSEKKCGEFCFLCNRVLGKRSNLLKHMDNCSMNRDEDKNRTQIAEKFSCNFCDENIISIEHLEKHLLNHVTSS